MEREQPGARMIGLAEAAQQLGLPYQDAHRLVLTGRLQGEKRGNRWYVPKQSVEKLLAEEARAVGRHGTKP